MAVEPRTRAFLDSLATYKGPPIYELPVPAARELLSGLQQGDVPKLPADIEERILPVGPTGRIPVRIVRPKGVTTPLPVVLYLHGGGWILGDAGTHDRLVRAIAHEAHAAVVFVDYDRSPEARYPTALEQSYAVACHVAEHGKDLGLAGDRLVVAGDSVGGNMATALTMLAKVRGGPRVDFQALFYPVTDAKMDTPSYRQFATGHWLLADAMKWFWNAYQPEVQARSLPTLSPVRATRQQLVGLPPALVITAENDVLRDEGEAYAHHLADAGVDVVAARFSGSIHDFMMLDALADTPAARGALTLTVATLRQRFAREVAPGRVTLLPEGTHADISSYD